MEWCQEEKRARSEQGVKELKRVSHQRKGSDGSEGAWWKEAPKGGGGSMGVFTSTGSVNRSGPRPKPARSQARSQHDAAPPMAYGSDATSDARDQVLSTG